MDSNSRFLLINFRKYYKENRVILPYRFTRREFGFMFFDKTFVQRHLSFPNQREIDRYMESQVPAHSYYSTSYYRKPDAPTMEEKGWLGAELIFDLDADHLENADKMTFTEMLDQIKREMIHLLDSFIFGDLGIPEKNVEITFSGGRGYHAHVKLPEAMGIGSHERREIADYITSTGLNMDWVFPYERVATGSGTAAQGRVSSSKHRLIPPADSGGWRLRMRDGLKDVVNDICDMDVKEIKKRYPSTKKNQSLEKIQADLRLSRNVIFNNNKMATLKPNTQDLLIKIMSEDMIKELSGEVDVPVTTDIKRIIRLPGSVHGKTGLRVTPLTRDQLNDFDPMEMAVPQSYSDKEILVTMKKDTDIWIKGEHFKLSGSEMVPEYAAVFLVGRKLADVGEGVKKDSFF